MSAAFHSRFVAHGQEGLKQSLAAVTLSPGRIPVFANTTGSLYAEDAESARELLAGQLARPVEFVSQVEAMYQTGARTFLEVGPGARLTGLIRAILEGREHHAIAIDTASSHPDDGNLVGLAMALAKLSALGYPVNLKQWDAGYPVSAAVPASNRKQLTVKVCGAHPAPTRVRDGTTDHRPKGGPDDVAILPTITELARTAISALESRTSPSTENNGNSQGGHHVGKNEFLDRTMNPSHHDPHPDSNGRTSSLPSISQPSVPVPGPAVPDAAFPVISTSNRSELSQAIRQTQESLAGLQRLAEQTGSCTASFSRVRPRPSRRSRRCWSTSNALPWLCWERVARCPSPYKKPRHCLRKPALPRWFPHLQGHPRPADARPKTSTARALRRPQSWQPRRSART